MKRDQIDDVLRNLQQGKKCYCGFDDTELSTVISIEQDGPNVFRYTCSTGHRYDVVTPTHYDHRLLNEKELRTLLEELSEETAQNISYIEKEGLDATTSEKVNLICSYLRHSPRIVFVVLKAGRHEKSEGQTVMHFHSVFNTREQAEKMMGHLKNKLGSDCSLKEITLTLWNNAITLQGELTGLDQVSSKQVLVSLLHLEPNGIAEFFNGSKAQRSQ